MCHVVVFQAPDWTVRFRDQPVNFLPGTIPSPLSLHETQVVDGTTRLPFQG